MVRFVGLALLCAIATLSLPARGAPPSKMARPPSGFELPALSGSYPGNTFNFEAGDAKRLAHELIPIIASDVTRATVQENWVIPGAHYVGLTVDFTLGVRSADQDMICEERHAYITFVYDRADLSGPKGQRLVVKDGVIARHSLGGLAWHSRYITAPSSVDPQHPVADRCALVAIDAPGWRHAASLSDYIGEVRRLSALHQALETLPMSQIICVGPDDKPCGYDRPALIATFKNAPPEQSASSYIPDEGMVSRYSHWGYNDAARLDYDVILRADASGRPITLRIRFSKSLPPPVI